jgi:hypothetical protein
MTFKFWPGQLNLGWKMSNRTSVLPSLELQGGRKCSIDRTPLDLITQISTDKNSDDYYEAAEPISYHLGVDVGRLQNQGCSGNGLSLMQAH